MLCFRRRHSAIDSTSTPCAVPIISRAHLLAYEPTPLCLQVSTVHGHEVANDNKTFLLGYLLGAAAPDIRSTISKDLIFNGKVSFEVFLPYSNALHALGLTLLLKEPEIEVRLAAADAISYLHSY